MSQQICLLRVGIQLKALQSKQSMRSAETSKQSLDAEHQLTKVFAIFGRKAYKSWWKYLQSWNAVWWCLSCWHKLTTTKVFAWVAFKWRQRQRWCRDNENTSIDLRCHSAQSHHFVNTYTLWTHIYFGLCCLNERFAWYAWYGTYLNL